MQLLPQEQNIARGEGNKESKSSLSRSESSSEWLHAYIRLLCCMHSSMFFCDMLQVRRLQEEQYYLKEQVGDRRLGKYYAKCLDRL